MATAKQQQLLEQLNRLSFDDQLGAIIKKGVENTPDDVAEAETTRLRSAFAELPAAVDRFMQAGAEAASCEISPDSWMEMFEQAIGLEPRQTLFVTGARGTGKTTIVLQMVGRAIANGEPTLVVSDDAHRIVREATDLGFSFNNAVRERTLNILEWKGRVESQADVDTLVGEIQQHIAETDARTLVIDPVDMLMGRFSKDDQVGQSVMSGLAQLPITKIMVSHHSPDVESISDKIVTVDHGVDCRVLRPAGGSVPIGERLFRGKRLFRIVPGDLRYRL
jgi:hypothetical protein